MKKLLLVGILFLTASVRVGIAGAPCAVVPMPAGWSMIANPCDGGAMPLNAFLTGMPGGTEIYKLVGTTYEYDLFLDGLWDGGGVITLGPGEGAYIYLPMAAALGYGGVPPVSPIPFVIPAGYSICSPPAGLGMTGYPAAEGDIIFRFINPDSWAIYQFTEGFWIPEDPAPVVGESFWVFKFAAAVWVQ